VGRSVHWYHLTWPEIEEAASGGAVVIIPCGSIEQHGLHLPTGTDVLISQGLAEQLVLAMPNRRFVLAVPITYAVARPNTPFPGSISICGTTLVALARDVVAELLRQGFDRILFLNGHMEGAAFIMEGAELALQQWRNGPAGTDRAEPRLVWCNWWELLEEEMVADILGDRWPGWDAEHAGLTETSLMLYLCPGLVRNFSSGDHRYQRLPYKILNWPPRTRPPSGSYGDPSGANADIGQRLAEAVVARLRQLVEREF